MNQRSQDFALGITAIVFLVLFLGTVLFVYPMFSERGQELVIHFDHVQGMAPLKEGSSVVLGGSMEIGRVTSVQIESIERKGNVDQTTFIVTAEINPNIELYGNCQITTDQPAIGGNGFVSILNVGTPDTPLEQPLQGLPPQSLASAIGQLSRRLLAEGGLVDNLDMAMNPSVEGSLHNKVLSILDDLSVTTAQLRTQMSPADQKTLLAKLHGILDDVQATTGAMRTELAAGNDAAIIAKVHSTLDQLGAALHEATAMLAEERPLIHATLESVSSAARTLDEELLAELRGELNAENPDSLLGKVHASMDRVGSALTRVEAMTVTGERLVKVNRPTIEQTLENLESMSANLEHAALKVLLNPRSLLFASGQPREEQLLVFQAARSFADAASQLESASGRLEGMLATMPADGPLPAEDAAELEGIREEIQAAFQRFQRAEEVLWEEMK